MSEEVKKLLEKLMSLSESERAEIASELLASLPFPPDGAYEEDDDALEAELARRYEEVKNGTVKTIPWEEVRAQLLKR